MRKRHGKGISAIDDFSSNEIRLIVDYAKSVFRSAWDTAGTIVSDGDARIIICLQYMYFYIHVTSRYLESKVSEIQLLRIMERVSDACGLAFASVPCQGEPKAHWNRIRDQFDQQAGFAHQDYSRFESFQTKAGEDATETLMWQFGSVIAMSVGKDNDEAIIARTIDSATQTLTHLDPDGFATSLSQLLRGTNGSDS